MRFDGNWTENEEGFDPYPELRELLAPEFQDLAPAEVEQLLAGISAEDLESFWSGLKSFGQVTGGVLQQALPAVATVAGTALGGPVGGMVGGMAGQALSGAIGGAMRGSGRGRGRPSRSGFASGPMHGVAGVAGRALPRAAGSPAAAQLLRLVTRPETIRALLSMVLGGAARRHVPVGNMPVPAGAFTNLLGVLANQAAAEYHQATASEASGTPLYLLDASGEFISDPADPVQRAEVLLGRLAEADALAAETEERALEAAPGRSWVGSLADRDDEMELLAFAEEDD